MKYKKAIIVFTRIPIAGETKTRMMPYFSAEECKELHICFLKDIAKVCKQVDADVYVYYTPNGSPRILREVFGRQVRYHMQTGAELGERMHHAMQEVLSCGYDAAVLIGTDVPEICSAHLQRSFALLRKKDVVFGPSRDGGYYLVGMKRMYPQVFEKQTYGGSDVLANTVSKLRESFFCVGFVSALYDLDTKEDILAYRERMRNKRQMQRSYTGKYLMRKQKISVIIPIYNEHKTIDAMVKQLKPLQKTCEILFVDGGSTDGTKEKIPHEFRVLEAQKGRAHQMNVGAKHSSGDVLFFLHCDSELPDRAIAQIRKVMKDYRVGCFGIAFHSKHFFLWTCRVISNHRIKDRKVMFGDQGIFVDRTLFLEVGMFPELPIMEDYQFSLTLKEKGIPIGMTRQRIYTSDRRFPASTIGKLRIMWKMNRLRKLYREEVPIDVISESYRDVR